MKRKLHSTDDTAEDTRPRRGELRRQQQQEEAAFLELAGELVLVDEEDVEGLELPEDVGDAVASARACKLGKPRNRALRLVRAALRDLEAEEVAEIRRRLSKLR